MTIRNGGAKSKGETDEEADATDGGFGGRADGDLGWWEGSIINEKSRMAG